MEARYPFLDVDVVQEYLWLDHEVKNAVYKRPVHDYFEKYQYAFDWGKRGFSAGQHLRAIPRALFQNFTQQGAQENCSFMRSMSTSKPQDSNQLQLACNGPYLIKARSRLTSFVLRQEYASHFACAISA